MSISKRQLGAVVAWVVLGWTATAWADTVMIHFHGAHPVDPKIIQAMCRIEGPHLHAYAPHKPFLYNRVGASWWFVGDPSEFEVDGPKHAYYGHHPVFWIDGPADHYCYITGPHHHWHAPRPSLEFKLKGGAYWYVGAHPGWYKKRRARHRKIARYYATVEIARPVIRVTPPTGFVGVVVGPGGVRAGAVIHSPGVQVNIPVPSVGIVVGGGGRVVHHRHYRGGRKVKYKGKYKRKRRGPRGHAPAWGHRGKRKGRKR